MRNTLSAFAFLMILSSCVGPKGQQGLVGPQGPKGDPGIPGTSCVAESTTGGVNILCGTNPTVFLADGINGNDGAPGLQGPIGIQGTSCTVTTLLPSHDNPTGGAQITCAEQSAIVINGATSGSSSAFVIVSSIDPCGASGGHDEVFLRMASGALVALFVDNGSALTARLAFLHDGIGYQSTDSQHCNFSLTTDENGLRTINYTSPVVGSESWQTY